MAATEQATRDAADTWARRHGCRDITSCNATPLVAFAAGMAAELRDAVTGKRDDRPSTATHEDQED